MSRDIWNPRQYREYDSERARPFFELLARVHTKTPAYVVDLGCGPGERTADLAAHWPTALVEGIDSSAQMIAEAQLIATQRNPATERAASRAEASTGAGTGLTDRTGTGRDTRPGAGGFGAGSSGNSPGGEDGTAGRDAYPGDGAGGRAGGGGLRFAVGDIAAWRPERPVDVIFSNAAFQWVPEHRRLLSGWVEALAPGGWLAFSVPGNFDGPSHTVLRELAGSSRWRERLGHTIRRDVVVSDPAEYFELLSGLGCHVDAWETTYVQVLPGVDPVLEWMKGTALRPVIDALPAEEEREEFLAELAARLREVYPRGEYGTIFPFRRIFVVAAKVE